MRVQRALSSLDSSFLDRLRQGAWLVAVSSLLFGVGSLGYVFESLIPWHAHMFAWRYPVPQAWIMSFAIVMYGWGWLILASRHPSGEIDSRLLKAQQRTQRATCVQFAVSWTVGLALISTTLSKTMFSLFVVNHPYGVLLLLAWLFCTIPHYYFGLAYCYQLSLRTTISRLRILSRISTHVLTAVLVLFLMVIFVGCAGVASGGFGGLAIVVAAIALVVAWSSYLSFFVCFTRHVGSILAARCVKA